MKSKQLLKISASLRLCVCKMFKYVYNKKIRIFPDFVTVSPKNHQRTKVRSVDAVS